MHDQTTADFIKDNANADIRQLALKKVAGVDMPFALDQIAGRQTARKKLPSWAVIDGIVYPKHLSMEQCSGEVTARYKASVAKRLLDGGCMVDITGGFGVDFSFMAIGFSKAVYVERTEQLCDIAKENFKTLGLNNVEVVCADGTEYLKNIPHTGLVFVDPARRGAYGKRTFGIADCTPNVISLRETLLAQADFVMIKLSPMLDWRKAVNDMGSNVGEVHIVSVGGECKELLLVMSKQYAGVKRVYCVNDGDAFDFSPRDECEGLFGNPQVGQWLYEPNSSVMKSGCFAQLGCSFGVRQIERNSHLFVSNERKNAFPGRCFLIEKVTTMNKKALKMLNISKANIAVRNFPMSVAELRKRLKISEGGNVYIFATTLMDRTHVLLICSKAVA